VLLCETVPVWEMDRDLEGLVTTQEISWVMLLARLLAGSLYFLSDRYISTPHIIRSCHEGRAGRSTLDLRNAASFTLKKVLSNESHRRTKIMQNLVYSKIFMGISTRS
jgi:hypothetical protein